MNHDLNSIIWLIFDCAMKYADDPSVNWLTGEALKSDVMTV